MKENVSRNGRSLTRLALLSVLPLLGALLLLLPGRGPSVTTAAEPAFQVLRPWTAVGSSGAVDEASLNLYAFGTADIGFRPNAAGNVVTARYNVTNTFDNNANPSRPGWTTLEMGSVAPVNTIIEAKLFEIRNCTTDPVLICSARNRSMDNPCARCTFPNTQVDFTTKLFYVEVTLTRPVNSVLAPRMFTLRIF